MSIVSTEGRVFAAQMTRDLAARGAAGAHLLAPGTKNWSDAFQAWGKAMSEVGGPRQAVFAFKAGITRLRKAQEDAACFVNCHMSRSRSGGCEVLTWEVAKHPLTNVGFEGILVRGYICMLRRNGHIMMNRSRLAFISWHALARMRERSKIDLFSSRGVVAYCGITGLLMRRSDKHANTGVHLAVENLLCAGVLRCASDEVGRYAFFDVLTALQQSEEGPQVRQWQQGCEISYIVHKYLTGDDADPTGYADKVSVLLPRSDDYVSRELRKAG